MFSFCRFHCLVFIKKYTAVVKQRRAAVIQKFSSKIRRGGIIQCHHRFNMGSWPAAIAGGQVSILYTTIMQVSLMELDRNTKNVHCSALLALCGLPEWPCQGLAKFGHIENLI